MRRMVSFDDPIYRIALLELSFPQDCKDNILRRAASSNGLSIHPGGEHQKVTKDGQHVTVIPNSIKPNGTCREIINTLNKHADQEKPKGGEDHEGSAKVQIPDPVKKHMDKANQISHDAKVKNTPEHHDRAAEAHAAVADKLGLFHGNAASHHIRMAQHHQEMAGKLRQRCPPGMHKDPRGNCQKAPPAGMPPRRF